LISMVWIDVDRWRLGINRPSSLTGDFPRLKGDE
jgi:hypothetical protein